MITKTIFLDLSGALTASVVAPVSGTIVEVSCDWNLGPGVSTVELSKSPVIGTAATIFRTKIVGETVNGESLGGNTALRALSEKISAGDKLYGYATTTPTTCFLQIVVAVS